MKATPPERTVRSGGFLRAFGEASKKKLLPIAESTFVNMAQTPPPREMADASMADAPLFSAERQRDFADNEPVGANAEKSKKPALFLKDRSFRPFRKGR